MKPFEFLKNRISWLFFEVDIEALEAAMYFVSIWTGWRIGIPSKEEKLTSFWILLSKLPSPSIGYFFCYCMGVILVTAGAMGILSLLEEYVKFRRLSSMICMFFWLYTGTMLAFAFPYYYTPGIHLMFAFFCSWIYCRIGRLETKKKSNSPINNPINLDRTIFKYSDSPKIVKHYLYSEDFPNLREYVAQSLAEENGIRSVDSTETANYHSN